MMNIGMKEGRKERMKHLSMHKARYCLIADEVGLWNVRSDFARVISCVVIIFCNVDRIEVYGDE